MSTFDGSQESARVTLQQTDPHDPLFTFLSAYVGAPAPPLPEALDTLSSPPQTSQSPPSQSESSPRLPVFTQMQSPQSTTSTALTTPPVISEAASHTQSVSSTAQPPTVSPFSSVLSSSATTSTDTTATQPPPSLSTAQASDVVSIAESIASQVTSFFETNPLGSLEPSAPSSDLVQTASHADYLAQELARTVTNLLPGLPAGQEVPSSQLVPTSSTTASMTTSTSLSIPQASPPTAGGTQSPSPSDTLAPLISSLQMPTLPGPSNLESTTQQAEGTGTQEPASLTLAEAGERVVAEETEETSVVDGQPWPVVGEVYSQGMGTDRDLEQLPSAALAGVIHPLLSESGQSSSTATATPAEEGGGGSDEAATTGATATSSASGTTAMATQQLPESIDQDVLAALPDSIRQEVLAQHAREQRARRAQQEGFSSSISPEFLAALPTNIQEELIQQERLEQSRQQQSQAQASAGPIDNASFFHNLTPELRRTILSDVDDSIINHLPEDIASEARALRQERETRRRQILEQRHAVLERIFEQASSGEPGTAYMHAPPAWDPSGYRYAILNLNPQHIVDAHHHLGRLGGLHQHYVGSHVLQGGKGELSSKQMLDQEALSCLLVLLFLDQNRLHNNRLHRIVKNLSQHAPTRAWILSSLLAILHETGPISHPLAVTHTCPMPPPLTPQQTSEAQSSVATTSTPVHHHFTTPHWLNLSINAALGSHARVFHFQPSVKVGTNPQISIHPLASIQVCSNVLDLLIFLSRQFPSSFLPSDLMPSDKPTSGAASSSAGAAEAKDEQSDVISNFWQILLRLDGAVSRKGKSSLKGFQFQETSKTCLAKELFSRSSIGQLMVLLHHEVVQESISLTDKLLRVLSVASGPIPRAGLSRRTTEPPPGEAASGRDQKQVQRVAKPDGVSSSGQVATGDDVFVQEEEVVNPSLLQIVISILTSGQCSEDGLEDATQLLTNLSKCSINTRENILVMLLDGIRTIGLTLCTQIGILLQDLRMNWESLKVRRYSMLPEEQESTSTKTATTTGATSGETASSTLATSAAASNLIPGVVLPGVSSDQQSVDHSKDLHLPSMVPLTCKGSQQSFFLRMLKVVCQLRESAQAALQGAQRSAATARSETESTSAQRSAREGTTPTSTSQGEDARTGQPSAPTQQSEGEGERAMDVGSSQGGGEGATGSSEAGPSQVVPEASSQAMDVGGPPEDKGDEVRSKELVASHPFILQSLSVQLALDELWSTLSECLDWLAQTNDPHAVLIMQPTVEAFFLVHASSSEDSKALKKARSSSSRSRFGRHSFHTLSDSESNPVSPAPHMDISPLPSTPSLAKGEDPYSHLPPETARFLQFAEKHRTVLNQILRQSTVPLAEGPFAVLVHYTKVLDFDIKRRYFRHELELMDDGLRREDIVVHLRREHVFEDAFRELYRRPPEDFKGNLYIQFEGEEGQDAGGLLREFYIIIARDMFNPNYALFTTSPGDRVTYMPNPSSHVNPNHLNYFRFIGRMIAKAIYDNKLLDCYFTRSFYKHILGKAVHYTDMESEDYAFYQGMVYLLEHNMDDLGADLTFSIEIQEFGKTEVKDLKENGRHTPITEANKREYVQLACQMKMTESIKSQIKSFLEGFYEIIPKDLISIFNEQELELLISGLPTIDIDDLKANSEYRGYQENSLQVQWFWRALRSFDQADRARFLQFVTGTSKVPLQGFAALEGMNGIQKFQIHRDDRSTDRLPCAHTCFNQLDLPPYETYDKLKQMLLLAVRECPEGFGFA